MNPANFRLLIHHHDIAYSPGPGEYWLTAGIARWVTALSEHFKEIGLLVYQSQKRRPRQDTLVNKANIKLHSLGSPGNYRDRFSRLARIRRVSHKAGKDADGLLIRGLTPRQYTVWKNTPVSKKAFLLVRSPKQNRVTKLIPMDLLSAAVNRYREYEFGRIARSDSVIMANSPVHISELQDLFGIKAYFVPTNTILKKEFAPLQVRPISNPIKILYVGRIHFLKGLRELFEAVATLQFQGQAVSLEIVGLPEEPATSQLQAMADDLGISDLICWHGYVPYGPGLFELYRTADYFILPSYTEGFPRVLWEAAANCCPVIATSVGGIPAIFKHGQQAFLIPPKKSDAIVEAVQQLKSDLELHSQLVENAYQYALGFTVEACAQILAERLAQEWN